MATARCVAAGPGDKEQSRCIFDASDNELCSFLLFVCNLGCGAFQSLDITQQALEGHYIMMALTPGRNADLGTDV
jgi:hypothetical protein